MSLHATSYKKALALLASDERYSEVLSQGTLRAGIYAPHHSDDRETDSVDMAYVVLNGSGFFATEGEKQPFGPGDLLFADADTRHHFEDFTPDFAVWSFAWSAPASGD